MQRQSIDRRPLAAAVVAGTLMMAAWAGRAEAVPACTDGSDCDGRVCQAGLCVSGFDSPGFDGGESCQAADDCQSVICQAGACVPPGLAHIAELQIDITAPEVGDLLTATAHQFVDPQLCAIAPFACSSASNAPLCEVDHLEIPASGQHMLLRRRAAPETITRLGHTITRRPVQAVVPFRIAQQRHDCHSQPDVSCPPLDVEPPAPFIVNMILDLATDVDGSGDVRLCATVADAELALAGQSVGDSILNSTDPTLADLKKTLQDALAQGAGTPQCIDLSQLTGVLQKAAGIQLWDAELSASGTDDDTGTRLAVRVWLGDESCGLGGCNDFPCDLPKSCLSSGALSADTLTTFFAGQLAPSPEGTGWSAFLGYGLLASLAQLEVTTHLPQGFFGNPSWQSWTPSPPTVVAAVTGHSLDFVEGCETDFDAAASGTFSLDHPNHRVLFAGTVDPSASFHGCLAAVGNPLVSAFIDAFIAAKFNGQDLTLSLFPGAACTVNVGALQFICELPDLTPSVQPFAAGPSFQASIDNLFGATNGLVLGGRLRSSGFPLHRHLVVQMSELEAPTRPPCSSDRLIWRATIDIDGSGQYCGIVPNDPLGWYFVTDLEPLSTTLPKHLLVESLGGDGPAAPYPFAAEVRTTDGQAFVTTPIPPALPASTWISIIRGIGERASQCNLGNGGFLGIPGRYDPRWAGDPALDRAASVRLDSGARAAAVARVVSSTFVLQGTPNVRVGASAAAAGHRFLLDQQPVTVRGQVLVEGDGIAAFTAPFAAPLAMDLAGDFLPSGGATPGLSALQLVGGMAVPVSAVAAMPGGHAGVVSFNLVVPPDAVTLYGFLSGVDSTCDHGADAAARNAGAPMHEAGTCGDGDGFTLADGIAACAGPLNYFGYACSDFAGDGSGAATRAWTAYYGCCGSEP